MVTPPNLALSVKTFVNPQPRATAIRRNEGDNANTL